MGSIGLLLAAVAVPYLLYANGSAFLMDNADLFVVFFLVAILLSMRAWGAERFIGMALLGLGIVLLALLYHYGLTAFNRLLVIPLMLIVIGFVLHVRSMKKQSSY